MRKFYYQDYRNTLLNIRPEDFKGKYNHQYPTSINKNRKKKKNYVIPKKNKT